MGGRVFEESQRGPARSESCVCIARELHAERRPMFLIYGAAFQRSYFIPDAQGKVLDDKLRR